MINSFIQQSIPLEFRPSYKRHDFIVGNSNKYAVDWIDKFPFWKEPGLIIIGPKSSGKSHLARVLKYRSNCIIKHLTISSDIKSIDEVVNVFLEKITPKTKVVSFTHISNITGFRLPAKEICHAIKNKFKQITRLLPINFRDRFKDFFRLGSLR